MSACPIMPHPAARLQSTHAGIRRKTGRTGTLRDHDGRAPGTPRRHHGRHHRRDGAGRPARRLLPEPALARQARDGYSDHHEEPVRRQRADPERDGRTEKAPVVNVDSLPGTQGTDAAAANQHAMAGRKSNGNTQNPCQAYNGAANQIAEDIRKGDQASIAEALHIIQDARSPSHGPFGPWHGGSTIYLSTGPFSPPAT